MSLLHSQRRRRLGAAAAALLTWGLATWGLASRASARATWSHETLGAVWAAPLVTPEGTIVVGSEDGILYALSQEGRLAWSYKASEGWGGWPVWLRGPKLVAAGNRNGTLYFFRADGEVKHKAAVEGPVVGPPAVFKDRLYLGTASGRLLAVGDDGRILWYHAARRAVSGYPAVSGDGKRIYAGFEDGGVIALDAAGGRQWEARLRQPVRGGLVATTAGGVIAAATGTFKDEGGKRGEVVALGGRGEVLWRRPVHSAPGGVAALAPDGVLVGTEEGELLALATKDGKPRWRFKADGGIRGLPTASGPWILLGTERGTLYVLDRRGRPAGLVSAAEAIRGGITVSRGRALFGASDRRLYAVPLPSARVPGRWQRAAALKARLLRAPRGTQLWRRELSGSVAAGVTPGRAGTFIAATWGNKVFVLDRKGEVEWSYNCGAEIWTLPAVSPQGDLLFGCNDGGFYGLKPDGNLRFRIPVNKRLASSPAVARDGTVYFGARDRRIYAVSREGKIRWRIRTGDDADGAPRIAPDGVVYAGSDDRHLYAINPNGDIIWYKRLPGAIRSRPALAKDGTVYVTAMDQRLHALSRDGAHRWELQASGQIVSSPAVSAEGVVFFGARDHKLYAVGPDGKLRWRFATAGEVDSSPVITSDGAVAVGSDDGHLYVLDPKTGELRWWFAAGAEIRGELVAAGGGSVILGTMDGGVVAVAPPKPPKPGAAAKEAPQPRRTRVGRGRGGPAVVDPEGQLIVAGEDGVIRAFGPDRWPVWRLPVGSDLLSRIHRVEAGIYAVTDARGELTLFEPGRLRFKLRLARARPGPPSSVQTPEGALVLVGTRSGRLWAVTTEGKVRWFFSGGGPITRPAVALDGGTILLAAERELVALDRSGHRRWSRTAAAGVLAGPGLLEQGALVGDGLGTLGRQGPRRAAPDWEQDLGAGVLQIEPMPDQGSAMVLLADGRVLEVAASGEKLLEVAPPTPPQEIVHAGSGVVYLVGGDNALLRLDRRTGVVRRVLDLAARPLHLGPDDSGSGGVIVITAQGVIRKAGLDRKTE